MTRKSKTSFLHSSLRHSREGRNPHHYVIFGLDPKIHPDILKNDEYILKGKVKRVTFTSTSKKPGEIYISYGIEQYFIPQGKGRGITLNNAFAKVVIDKNGNPVLQKLFIDGKEF